MIFDQVPLIDQQPNSVPSRWPGICAAGFSVTLAASQAAVCRPVSCQARHFVAGVYEQMAVAEARCSRGGHARQMVPVIRPEPSGSRTSSVAVVR